VFVIQQRKKEITLTPFVAKKKNIAGHSLTSNLLKNQPGIIDANDQLVPLYQKKKSKQKRCNPAKARSGTFPKFPPFCTMGAGFFPSLEINVKKDNFLNLGFVGKHFRNNNHSHCAL
jgi:hypothetical protein